MRKLLLAFLVAVCVSGCAPGPRWDKEKIEQTIRTDDVHWTEKSGSKIECTSVSLVSDGENSFIGFAEYSDGTQKKVTVNVDPHTGKYVYNVR